MVTVKSLEQYHEVNRKRAERLKSLKRRGPITSAKFMTLQLRSMCPVGKWAHPGYPKLYQTIKRSKNKVSVGGYNPKTGFQYVHWINETEGTDFITSWSRRYSQLEEPSGTPGFYSIALHRTHKHFREAMIEDTRKILSARF